jgi:UDP-2-acetamido-3-amino-2,3-dideoxy-glucuronate N-acetyltransferase
MQDDRYPHVFIHDTSLVASDQIGPGTRVWAFCNLLPGSRIGRDCQICDRVFIEGGAILGDGVTVKCGVSIWDGIHIASGVFIGPGAIFTNDPHPRSRRQVAAYPTTTIQRHASIGAGAIILPGITVGAFALVAAGAVVTRNVADFALVTGNPARQRGWVCVCAATLHGDVCNACGRVYESTDQGPHLIRGDDDPRGGD